MGTGSGYVGVEVAEFGACFWALVGFRVPCIPYLTLKGIAYLTPSSPT